MKCCVINPNHKDHFFFNEQKINDAKLKMFTKESFNWLITVCYDLHTLYLCCSYPSRRKKELKVLTMKLYI